MSSITLNNKIIDDPSKKVSQGDILKLEIPEPAKKFSQSTKSL